MAAFGEHNYGTPFGALSPSQFFNSLGSGYYDYSGFSTRSGLLGWSGLVGFSGYSAFCGPEGIEFIPFKPTLTFPLNFEVLQGTVNVTWRPSIPADPCDTNVVYELQFTRTFSRNSGWKTLAADIPAGVTSFQFDVSEIPYTDDGGLRLRAKDSRGIFSDFSHSNESFIIANHAPNPVKIMSPFGNESFDHCISVVWREAAIKDVDGHDVTYQIEITDRFSADIGWTVVPGAEALPVGTTTFNITSFDFPEGSDFGVRVSAVDELGLASEPRAAGPFIIRHEGTFFIDTIPPEGSMSINDGAALAASSKVRISLFATDASTGVKDVRFKNADEDCWGDFDTFTNEKFWDLSKSDGVKRVFVQFRDFADNVSEVCDCEIVSRVLCGAGNVTDIEVFNNKLYVAFDVDGNLMEYRVLVSTAAELAEPEVTALAKFNNFLYVASYDTDAVVYAFDGRARRTFTLTGTKILSMQAYNDLLFIGSDDGRIRSYDGTTLTTVYASGSAITRLRTDGAVLYATVQGGGEYLSSADGTTWKVNPL